MKRYTLTPAFALLASLGLAQQKEEVYAKMDFAASDVQRMEIATSGGFVTVEGGAEEKAQLTVILRPNGSNQLFRKGKDLHAIFEERYDLELGLENGLLVAKAKRKDNRGNNPLSVSFQITVPKQIESDIRTSSGSIKLSNLEGKQHFRTSAGSLTLASLSGAIRGGTSSGSIRLEDGRGTIELHTSAGSITLNNVNGETDIRTSSGSISANAISGTFRAKTSAGSITLDRCDGNIGASTSSGSIRASVTNLTDSLRLSTSAGSVRISVPEGAYDLDLKGLRADAPSGGFSGTMTRNAVKGKLNGGGRAISAKTLAGNVSLSWN